MENPQRDIQVYLSLKQLKITFENRVLKFLDKYGNTDFRLAIITVGLIILTGGDALIIIHNKFTNLSTSPTWLHLEKQSHGILTTQSNYPVAHHVSKLTFRLVAPLLGKLCFECNLLALAHFLIALEYTSGFVFILLFIKFLKQYVPDIVTVRWLTICLSFMFLGKIFFWDLGYFDGFALVSMFIGMTSNSIPIQFFFYSAAFWTDERSLLSVPLIWIWYLLRNDIKINTQAESTPFYLSFKIKKGHWALLLSIAAMIFGRWILIHFYSFPTKVDFAQLAKEAIHILKNGRLVKLSPFLLFSSFESLWVIILLAFYIIWKNSTKPEFIVLIIASMLSIGSAFLVADITRSIMYSFPLLIIAIRIVAVYLPINQLRKICFYIMLFAMIYPTYYMTDYLFPFFLKAIITKKGLY